MEEIEQKAIALFIEKVMAKLAKTTMADLAVMELTGDFVDEAARACKWFEDETGLSSSFYLPADMGAEPVGRAN